MAIYKTFTGFSSLNSAKPDTKLTDIDLIKQDLTNHFSIKKGEKLENPNFGSIIPYLLFEPYSDDVIAAIEDDVEAVINFDPRCRLDVVSVEQNEEGNGVNVYCEVTYIPFAESGTISWEFTTEGYVRLTS